MSNDRKMDYSRMVTALAMAKSECDKTLYLLRQSKERLDTLSVEIGKFLDSNPTHEIDNWYEAIRQEEKEERLARNATPPQEGETARLRALLKEAGEVIEDILGRPHSARVEDILNRIKAGGETP